LKTVKVKLESVVNNEVNGLPTSQLVFLHHVEEVLRECRYFGYLVYKDVIKDVIKDDDIISY
jgi:hypothetical protein